MNSNDYFDVHLRWVLTEGWAVVDLFPIRTNRYEQFSQAIDILKLLTSTSTRYGLTGSFFRQVSRIHRKLKQ